MFASLGANEQIDWGSIKNKEVFLSAVRCRIESLKKSAINLTPNEFVALMNSAKKLGIQTPKGRIDGSKPAYSALLYEILKLNSNK
ncbi:MAG: hypothetical protein PHC61_01280 [Chitinivibrionales bacterium]|nr:hypothetical protein [Chitinivibrionales bacterium]